MYFCFIDINEVVPYVYFILSESICYDEFILLVSSALNSWVITIGLGFVCRTCEPS